MGKITKTELLLLGLTAMFLCVLLVLRGQDSPTEVQVDTPVAQETFLPDLSPLDLNTARMEELVQLPGIGTVLAERILIYREEHGGFTSVEQLLEISGIGEAALETLRDRVTVNGGNDK